MGKIRIGIVGYGNIGRGVEQSIKRNDDMELKAVFTRRDPASVKIQTEGAEVKHFDLLRSPNSNHHKGLIRIVETEIPSTTSDQLT